jgi:hypothetical protein
MDGIETFVQEQIDRAGPWVPNRTSFMLELKGKVQGSQEAAALAAATAATDARLEAIEQAVSRISRDIASLKKHSL